MNSTQGHVTVNERMPSVRFQQFVEDQVKNWMTEREIPSVNSDFEVAFFEEEALGETSCLVVIHAGEHLWRSWETADNPRQALNRSLEHLREESGEDARDESRLADDDLANDDLGKSLHS